MCTLILSPTAVCKVVRMSSKACPITTSYFSKAILKTCQFRIKAKTQGSQHGDLSPRLPAAPLPLHIATSQKSRWLHLPSPRSGYNIPWKSQTSSQPKTFKLVPFILSFWFSSALGHLSGISLTLLGSLVQSHFLREAFSALLFKVAVSVIITV